MDNTVKTNEHIFMIDYNNGSCKILNYDDIDIESCSAISILRNRRFVRISIDDFINKNF